jgi:hypothetical protein
VRAKGGNLRWAGSRIISRVGAEAVAVMVICG